MAVKAGDYLTNLPLEKCKGLYLPLLGIVDSRAYNVP